MSQLSNRLLFPSIYSAAATILLLSQQTAAAEWKITPSLNLNETYSDNITLAPQGSEKSDWVTQINPGVSLTGTGSRLKANAGYVMQNLGYAEGSSRNVTKHQLSANANVELVDNLFFLDGRAAISQQNASQLGQHAVDNTSATGNRTDVKTYSFSPYLRHNSSDFASSEIRYTHNEANAGTSGLSDSRTDSIQLKLNSGTAFRTLGWGVDYSNEKTANTTTQDIDRESLSGNLRYLVTPKLSLTATGGYEKNSYISIASKPESSFWSAGFAWAPSTRTSVDASAGQRFFGNTYSINANHRTSSTAWALGYSEDITTTQSQFVIPVTISTASFLDQLWSAQIPDQTTRQLFIDAFIQSNGLPPALSEPVNFLSNRVFLQKRLQASVALTGKKNTLILSLFNALRDAQTSQTQDSILLGNTNQALNDKTKQVGGNASWNWRIGSRTSANLNAAYTRSSDSSLGSTNNSRSIRFGLTRQFQPKLSGSVELRRLQQSSSQSSNYQENAVTASLSMKF
ncbi:MAG: TIGR03016 family PEP-CTERM system-associated outer membrane protein [Gallionella sp.]|nr:MAG: TIGR03016 family PEP-CTERM system-associated outer membrane protein [Gallionella sp.]